MPLSPGSSKSAGKKYPPKLANPKRISPSPNHSSNRVSPRSLYSITREWLPPQACSSPPRSFRICSKNSPSIYSPICTSPKSQPSSQQRRTPPKTTSKTNSSLPPYSQPSPVPSPNPNQPQPPQTPQTRIPKPSPKSQKAFSVVFSRPPPAGFSMPPQEAYSGQLINKAMACFRAMACFQLAGCLLLGCSRGLLSRRGRLSSSRMGRTMRTGARTGRTTCSTRSQRKSTPPRPPSTTSTSQSPKTCSARPLPSSNAGPTRWSKR